MDRWSGWLRAGTCASAAALAACAQQAPPPGGPVDDIPPVLVAAEPGSLATGVDPNQPLVFTFTEKVDGASLRSALELAPPIFLRSVSVKGERVVVEPERPWPADSVVVWTVLPELRDHHRVGSGKTFWGAFTTGDSLPDGVIEGAVRRPELDFNLVMARLSLPADSVAIRPTLWRTAAADGAGRFRLTLLDTPSGPYDLEVFEDKDRNGRRDEREPVARADSLFLARGIRILDLGPLDLVDLEAPVDVWACMTASAMDSLPLIAVFIPIGSTERPQTAIADSTGCAGPAGLTPGPYQVSSWLDLDADGRFGPDSTGVSEPFTPMLEWEVLPEHPDTLFLPRPDEVLPWSEVDTLRPPPIPRQLFPTASP